MTPLVRADAVHKSYGAGRLSTPVLHGVSLEIHPGELTLLMGPSGSGKTTLISILTGLLRADGGRVEMCGAPISTMDEAAVGRIRRDRLGFVFQTYNLFPGLSALDNVAEVLVMKGWTRARARE